MKKLLLQALLAGLVVALFTACPGIFGPDDDGGGDLTVPITGLRDWLAVRDQLSRVGIIRQSEIVLMSRDQVRVNVHFVGGPEQLITALEQANLSMLQESGEWIIMPIGVFQPPKT